MKTWLVNTNSKDENGNPNAYKYMLRQNKAAAFYGKAGAVDKISKGDVVMLYHNDNRIIAVGCVVAPFEGHDFGHAVDSIEHWVDVNWLWKASLDSQSNPTSHIDRNVIGIRMVNNTVVNITDQVDYKILLSEVARMQSF